MLTEQEVNELFKNATVKFGHYYKYIFTFDYGGDTDDIYRYKVDVNKEKPFYRVDSWYRVYITKNGKCVFEETGWNK